MEAPRSLVADASLERRISRTVEIANRWGYGLAGAEVSRYLYGGPEDDATVASALAATRTVVFHDGIATLPGREDLIPKSVARRRSNGSLASLYFGIAEAFARDLLRHCPVVRSVAVSGSTASGGIEEGDDVDLNLIAEDGTRYTAYLSALLLGLKYSLKYGRRLATGRPFLGVLRKVTCVNVVWPVSATRPFVRQDPFLAFELLRSVPIAGTDEHGRMITSNPWLLPHFPQIRDAVHAERVRRPPPSPLGRLLLRVAARPRLRRGLDAAARLASAALHRLVALHRERDPRAAARAAFLRRVKFPYDVFQD